MVYYRRRRRTHARKPTAKKGYRRRRYAPARTRVPRPMSRSRMGGFPQHKTAVLRYMESQIALNPGAAGSAAASIFTGNGLYDPFISGTGHQPLGFDEWMVAYNHYTVTGFRMSVTFFNLDTVAPCFVGIKVTADGLTLTNGQETIEQGNARWRLLGPAGISGSKSMAKIVLTQDNSKFFGKDVLNERDFQGTATSNPAEQLYPTIFAFPNSSSDVGVVNCHVILEYKVVFTEPKLINQS